MFSNKRTGLCLYDRDTSGNCYKVRLLLSFLELPFERVEIKLEGGRNRVDDVYLTLNPRGQIPTLVHGETVLWGSTAILVYLASNFDHSKSWLPVQPAIMGHVMQWLELAQNEISHGLFRARAIRNFGYQGIWADAWREGLSALETLELHLSNHEWLAAGAPTIADIACFPYTVLAGEGGFNLETYIGVAAWIDRFKRLPRFIGMPGINLPDKSNQLQDIIDGLGGFSQVDSDNLVRSEQPT
jgi:glutathione S-transferase